MEPAGVLVVGCSDALANNGLKADERAITALQVPAKTISTGSASRNTEGHVEQIVETAPVDFKSQVDNIMRVMDCKVVKIGAMFSEEIVKTTSQVLQQNGTDGTSIIDAEVFFQTWPSSPKPEVVAALRRHLLPCVTLLSATVPEVMQLLEDAGVPADYPRGIPDVQALAKSLAQNLGPQYVVIKREFIDEDDGVTTLHYVLVGGGADAEPPVMVTSRFENPTRVFGASYYVSSAIAAYLAKGSSIPQAVSAGFEFVGEMIKTGELFQ